MHSYELLTLNSQGMNLMINTNGYLTMTTQDLTDLSTNTKARNKFTYAYAFIRIFTSYDNPKGNADTERVIRTIKEEIRMNASHNLAE